MYGIPGFISATWSDIRVCTIGLKRKNDDTMIHHWVFGVTYVRSSSFQTGQLHDSLSSNRCAADRGTNSSGAGWSPSMALRKQRSAALRATHLGHWFFHWILNPPQCLFVAATKTAKEGVGAASGFCREIRDLADMKGVPRGHDVSCILCSSNGGKSTKASNSRRVMRSSLAQEDIPSGKLT